MQREDLSKPNPDRHAQESLHRGNKGHYKDQDDYRAQRTSCWQQHAGKSHQQMANSGQRQPDHEGRPAIKAGHIAQADDAANDGNNAKSDIGQDRLLSGHASLFQHPRSVVHDRVDPGQLLHARHTDAHANNAQQPFVFQYRLDADGLVLQLFFFGHGPDFAHFGERPIS